MAQSPEYPQYRWMPPRSYTRGRAAGPAKWIVIHTTEGSEGPTSAEDGAAYDQRRTDGTSAHFYVDSDSAVQCVRTTDTAHTARYRGNLYGIHIEVCGRAGQSTAQWDDQVSRATIEQVAKLCRTLRARYPFPLVNLSPAQVRGLSAKGFCEHYDVTRAWGESTHTDPGPRFPWARLFSLVDDTVEDDEMTPAEKWVQHVMNYRVEALRANRITINIPARTDLGKSYKAITETNALAVALATLGGTPSERIVAEVRAQGEQTRAALLAAVTEQAPALAASVVDRLGADVTAAEIGEALAAELAAMLAGATSGDGGI